MLVGMPSAVLCCINRNKKSAPECLLKLRAMTDRTEICEDIVQCSSQSKLHLQVYR